MSFRLRRGTDSERQSVVFAEGELVYTTDSKELYVGDGTTLGGIKITGSVEVSPIALSRNLDLNTFDITGAGDITISGMISADAFYGNGANLTHLPVLDVNNGAAYQISIMGADSSIIVNSETSELRGDVFGSVTGSVFGVNNTVLVNGSTNTIDASHLSGVGNINVVGDTNGIHTGVSYGVHYGDVEGSVFTDNSSLIIDGRTGNIYPTDIISDGFLRITQNAGITGTNLLEINSNDNRSIIRLSRKSNADISNDSVLYGSIFFSRDDSTGLKTTAIIAVGKNGTFLQSDAAGEFPESSTISHLSANGYVGIGSYSPTEKLSVFGNATVSGFVQFGSLTSSEISALTATNGMVLYNSSTNRFQGYQNGSWIHLDDGTAV